jgi:hypothetical protein
MADLDLAFYLNAGPDPAPLSLINNCAANVRLLHFEGTFT